MECVVLQLSRDGLLKVGVDVQVLPHPHLELNQSSSESTANGSGANIFQCLIREKKLA
jgi:hypothetical protein